VSDDEEARRERMKEVFYRHAGGGMAQRSYNLPSFGYGSENDERRKVDRDSIERRIPNYDFDSMAQEDEDLYSSEPDFEGIMEARHEKRRPDWDQ
jgi:hypothetical protein